MLVHCLVQWLPDSSSQPQANLWTTLPNKMCKTSHRLAYGWLLQAVLPSPLQLPSSRFERAVVCAVQQLLSSVPLPLPLQFALHLFELVSQPFA